MGYFFPEANTYMSCNKYTPGLNDNKLLIKKSSTNIYIRINSQDRGDEALNEFIESVDNLFNTKSMRKKLFGNEIYKRFLFKPTIGKADENKNSTTVRFRFNTEEISDVECINKTIINKIFNGKIVKSKRSITDISNEIDVNSEMSFIFSFDKIWWLRDQLSRNFTYGIWFSVHVINYIPRTENYLYKNGKNDKIL